MKRWVGTKTHSEEEAKGNSEMAYLREIKSAFHEKKNCQFLTRAYVTYDNWKVTPKQSLVRCLLSVRFLFCAQQKEIRATTT